MVCHFSYHKKRKEKICHFKNMIVKRLLNQPIEVSSVHHSFIYLQIKGQPKLKIVYLFIPLTRLSAGLVDSCLVLFNLIFAFSYRCVLFVCAGSILMIEIVHFVELIENIILITQEIMFIKYRPIYLRNTFLLGGNT